MVTTTFMNFANTTNILILMATSVSFTRVTNMGMKGRLMIDVVSRCITKMCMRVTRNINIIDTTWCTVRRRNMGTSNRGIRGFIKTCNNIICTNISSISRRVNTCYINIIVRVCNTKMGCIRARNIMVGDSASYINVTS